MCDNYKQFYLMKNQLILFALPLIFGCSQNFLSNCSAENYFISNNQNMDSDFQNKQREVVTSFTEKELESLFNDTNISCKDVLTNFFYCNICFNNNDNYLISYNGKRYDLDSTSNPNIFINNVLALISSMQMGAEEYEHFLNTQKTE